MSLKKQSLFFQDTFFTLDAFLNDHKIPFFEKSCYVTWTEVIDPFLVEQILSWTVPISHSRVL